MHLQSSCHNRVYVAAEMWRPWTRTSLVSFFFTWSLLFVIATYQTKDRLYLVEIPVLLIFLVSKMCFLFICTIEVTKRWTYTCNECVFELKTHGRFKGPFDAVKKFFKSTSFQPSNSFVLILIDWLHHHWHIRPSFIWFNHRFILVRGSRGDTCLENTLNTWIGQIQHLPIAWLQVFGQWDGRKLEYLDETHTDTARTWKHQTENLGSITRELNPENLD